MTDDLTAATCLPTQKAGPPPRPELPHLRRAPRASRAKRSIPKSSKGHFVGELVFKRGNEDQRLGFESLLECRAALCLIYRDDFVDIEEQLAGLPYRRPNGLVGLHFFDFRVTTRARTRICVSVKPEKTAESALYKAVMNEVKKAAIGNICDAVATITERNICPITLHNSTLYHAARNPEPALDDEIAQALKRIDQPTTIDQFLADAGQSGRGFFSVARAIRFGHARLVRQEKIKGQTLILRAEAA